MQVYDGIGVILNFTAPADYRSVLLTNLVADSFYKANVSHRKWILLNLSSYDLWPILHTHAWIHNIAIIIQVTAYTSVGAGIAGMGNVTLQVGPRMLYLAKFCTDV